MSFTALSLGVVGAATLVIVLTRGTGFRPSLTVDQLNGFTHQNDDNGGSGSTALATYYGWRRDLWNGLARGLGGLSVALLLALVGAYLQATTTTTHSEATIFAAVAPPDAAATRDVLELIGGCGAVAACAWTRARALQEEFADDIGRL